LKNFFFFILFRRLPTSGTKATLIERLKTSEQRQQRESLNLIKREENEMQVDVAVPVIQQQQQLQAPTSLQVSDSRPSHEVMDNNVKYEYEPTLDGLQAMNKEENPAPELILPQQVLEHQQDLPPNVDMSNGYPESINPVGQQQIDHPFVSPSPPSATASPIVTHTDVVSSSSSTNNSSLEQNRNNQTQSFDSSIQSSSSSTYQRDEPPCEVDRDLLARLISERKYGTQNLYGVSRGIVMNQGRANGVPYNYDLLLEVVQGSLIYNDGEIPYWLKDTYDTTFGTTYSGESECVLNPGISVEDFFLNGFNGF